MVVRTVVVDKVEAGRGDFVTVVVVDDVDLFKAFSLSGDVAEVERRLAIGFNGDLAVVLAAVPVPFVIFVFDASEVGLGGALIRQNCK